LIIDQCDSLLLNNSTTEHSPNLFVRLSKETIGRDVHIKLVRYIVIQRCILQ